MRKFRNIGAMRKLVRAKKISRRAMARIWERHWLRIKQRLDAYETPAWLEDDKERVISAAIEGWVIPPAPRKKATARNEAPAHPVDVLSAASTEEEMDRIIQAYQAYSEEKTWFALRAKIVSHLKPFAGSRDQRLAILRDVVAEQHVCEMMQLFPKDPSVPFADWLDQIGGRE